MFLCANYLHGKWRPFFQLLFIRLESIWCMGSTMDAYLCNQASKELSISYYDKNITSLFLI